MVRHSKERALSEREFERVLQAVERIDDPWYRLREVLKALLLSAVIVAALIIVM